MYGMAWILYRTAQGGLIESTYIIQPGARPTDIHLKYNTPVRLLENGTLEFAFETGFITENAPIAFQDINGKRFSVEVHFTISEGLVGFNVGDYNPNYTLTIDPIYSWHAFYGTSNGLPSGIDDGKAITTDGSGNIYVAGNSETTWNGPGGVAPLNAFTGGNPDIVVVKLNSAGVYQWHTFYGSVSNDYCYAITSDGSGNIYVAGTGVYSWNGPGNTAPLNPYVGAGAEDIVIIKLNSAGAYQWHTFYGSSSNSLSSGKDFGYGITSDGSGIYMTGYSQVTWNGPGNVAPLNAHPGYSAIVVIKLNSAGTYQWHTFYGSSSGAFGYAIANDGNGNVYVTGTSSAWNGPNAVAPLNAFTNGSTDIVVVKLNSNGVYQWHTFYGSSGWDTGYAITCDGGGNVIVAGYSPASWSGPDSVSPLNPYAGYRDMVVLKLNSMGAYQWHTFYGSSINGDTSYAVTNDANGNIFIAGDSGGSWNGPGDTVPLNAYKGSSDIVVVKLNGDGAYQWHAFYGSLYADIGYAITKDRNGNVVVAGNSSATWDGPGNVTPLNPYSGSSDIVVIKLGISEPEMNVKGNSSSITDGDTTPSSVDYTDFGNADIASGTVDHTFTIENTGTAILNLTGTPKIDISGTNASDFTVTVSPTSPVAINGSTTFTVHFDPSAAGTRTATISIANNDSDENPYNFNIQGTGTAAPEMDVKGNGVSIVDGDTTPDATDHTDFGNANITLGTVDRTFIIANTGDGLLTLSGSPKVIIGGTDAADFFITADPTSSVAATSGSTTFTVHFDPSATGVRSATLSIDNNDRDENPYNFNIQGTGTAAPEMDVKGNGVSIGDGDTTPDIADHTDFGNLDIGAGTMDRTFTIYNNGNAVLILSGSPRVIIGGTDAADFSFVTGPTSPVAATNGSTTFTIGFNPTTIGLKSATISIANNDSDENPYNFNIQGTGIAAPEMDVKGNSVSIVDGDTTPDATDHTDFGSVSAANGIISHTFTIQNNGSAVLSLSGTPKVVIGGTNPSDFSVTTTPSDIVSPNNGTTTFIIEFDPAAEGLRSATISITNNDSDENPYNFNIQGTGTVSSTKDITAFSFKSLAVTGVITGTNIAVTVPFRTNVTELVPTITHNGASISPNSGVARDFTSPVTYTVTAANASTQVYTVTVTRAMNYQLFLPLLLR
jgi:hypothetical protein